MNSLDTALLALAATSWRIGLLIVLCLGLRRVLRGRLPAAAVFAMWLVLAGALLVPVGVPAAWSPFGLIPRFGSKVTPPTPVGPVQDSGFGVAPLGALTMPEMPALTLTPVEIPEPSLMDRLQAIPVSRWATVLWLAGVAVLVLRRAAALLIFSRRLRRDLAPADQRTVSAVERCQGLLGIRGEVTAGETSLVETPALHGIRRPQLLMPKGMADRLSDAELELVVLHELGHVRRRDLLAQTLIHGAAVLHWFNPLAWAAAHAARADCEHACDEFVLGQVEEERRHDYGAVLLKVVGLTSGPGRLPVVLGIFESKKQLQRRIHLIAGYSGRGRAGLLAGVALVGLVAAVALTREVVAQGEPAPAPIPDALTVRNESNSEPSELMRLEYDLAISRRRIANLQKSATPGSATTPALEAEQAKQRDLAQRLERARADQPAPWVSPATAMANGTVATTPTSVTIRVSAEGGIQWQGERIGLSDFMVRLQKYAVDTTPAATGPNPLGPQGRINLEADDATGFGQIFGYVANEVRKLKIPQVYLVAAANPATPVALESPPAVATTTPGLVVLQISGNDTLYWNQSRVTLAELPEKLKQGREDGTVTAMTIAGDLNARFQTVIRVIDLVKQSGIQKFSIDTQITETGRAGGVMAVPAALPSVTTAPAVPMSAGRSIQLFAIRTVRVQVNLRNADGTDGAIVLPNSELKEGESRLVPWTTALSITASAGENLQVEVNGKRLGVGFVGYRQSWLPSPENLPAGSEGVMAVPAAATPVVNAAPARGVKEFSPAVAARMPQLKALTDGSDLAGAVALLDELLKAGTPGDSFDQAQLNLYKGNLLLQMPDTRGAIVPLEKALEINSRVDLLPAGDITQAHKNLAIVYFVAVDAPNQTAADRASLINQVIVHDEEYLKRTSRKTVDDMYQYASFLYRKATMDRADDKVDLALVRQARQVATDALSLSISFPAPLYRFIMAMHQHEGDKEGAARVAELLLTKDPKSQENVRLWQMLPGLYLGLANDMAEKNNVAQAKEYRFRAISAYERAQANAELFKGDNGQDATSHILNLAKTYFDVGQIEKGAEVMLEGARANKIKGAMEQRAWLFSSTYYDQAGKKDQAIAVLKEAAARYPADGQFDLQLANAYYAREQLDDAIVSIREAARKGVPGREATIRLSEAYYLYQANRYAEATEAAIKGLALPNLTQQVKSQLQQIRTQADAEAAKGRPLSAVDGGARSQVVAAVAVPGGGAVAQLAGAATPTTQAAGENSPNIIVARVGDVVITTADVMKEVTPILPGIRANTVDQKDYMAKVSQAQELVIQNLINRALVIQDFRKLKPGEKEVRKIPDADIDEELAQIEKRDFGGDRAKFLASIEAQGLTRAQYRQRIEEDFIFRYMLGQMRSNSAPLGNGTPQQAREASQQAYDAWIESLRTGINVQRF